MRIEEDIRKIFPYYKDKAKSTERTTGTLLYKKIMYTREAVIEAQTSSTTEWYSVLSFFLETAWTFVKCWLYFWGVPLRSIPTAASRNSARNSGSRVFVTLFIPCTQELSGVLIRVCEDDVYGVTKGKYRKQRETFVYKCGFWWKQKLHT